MKSNNYTGIWIFAEQENGVIEPTVYELLAKAQELKTHNGETVTAILLGNEVASLANTLIACGADRVIVAEHRNLAAYSARPYQRALAELAEKYMPSILLYGATSLGRDLAPRLMNPLNTGLTADAIDLGFDEDGVFYQTTPAYGGNILAHIVIAEKRPQMATVRPKIFQPLEYDAARHGEIIVEKISVESDSDYKVVSVEPRQADGVPINEAKLIVSGGRGIKDAEQLTLLKELAGEMGAELASSRPLVDCGMLSHDRQIGQSGATVKPELILNVAISGSVQYQIGMRDAKRIVSINHTPGAPIFDISDYGAIADFKQLVPAITAELKKRRGGSDNEALAK